MTKTQSRELQICDQVQQRLTRRLAVAGRVWRELGAKEYATPAVPGEAPVTVRVTASLGVAFYPSKDITSGELLLRFADQALYQAKKSGRNTICLYQAAPYRYDAPQKS